MNLKESNVYFMQMSKRFDSERVEWDNTPISINIKSPWDYYQLLMDISIINQI